MSSVPALGRGLRQEDCCKFKINLDYIAIPCVKNQHTHTMFRGDKKDGSESTRCTSEDLSAVPSTQIWCPGTPPAPRASALPLDSMGTYALVYIATHIALLLFAVLKKTQPCVALAD